MKYLTIIAFLGPGSFCSIAQSITGAELLDLAIKYHDPKGQWSEFAAILDISMTRPDKPSRHSMVSVDFPKAYYKIYTKSDSSEAIFEIDGDECKVTWNGKTEFTPEEVETYRLTCDRAEFMRNYYIYLYGLPMKLKDPGTNVREAVQRKTFNDKEYNVLKVTYDEEVGKDTWYFYFDMKTNAMEVYQFFHDETKNDGEYILLDGIVQYGKMKIPSDRTWYTNYEDRLLGTDKLVKISKLGK
jgi:uncharacterized protein DUF6503